MYTGLWYFPYCVVFEHKFTDLYKCDTITYLYILQTFKDSSTVQNSLWNDKW